ncbi:MAG: response regulator [Treponemataceae bacterium]
MKQAILCVDDEAIIVLSLKQELRSHYRDQFLYETALNATEAMEIIEELASEGVKIITIISDWLMPGIKGDEFLARVHERYPDIRSIIITGQADEESLKRLKDDICLTAVLRKPWNSLDLFAAVDSCLV